MDGYRLRGILDRIRREVYGHDQADERDEMRPEGWQHCAADA